MDKHNIKQLFSTFGLYQDEFALELFQSWIAEKLGSENATFKDLKESGGLESRVFASKLNTRQIHEFSSQNSPNVPFTTAVRASMSVPLFFTAVEVGDHLFVDGGAILDYPIMAFGDAGIQNTHGLAFAGSSSAAAGDQDD